MTNTGKQFPPSLVSLFASEFLLQIYYGAHWLQPGHELQVEHETHQFPSPNFSCGIFIAYELEASR